MKKHVFFQSRSSWIALALGLFIIMAPLIGCGNDNIFNGLADQDSKEARTEEALMAMDDGDYQTAISILEDLLDDHPNDAQLWQYLSSAYSGSAGLDTLDLLEVLDELGDAGSGDIDMIGLVLGGDSGTLTADEIDAKLADIENAIDVLGNIADPDEDQTILLGLLSITHLSLTVGDMVAEDTGEDSIELTEDGISTLYGGTPADFTGLVDTDTIDDDLDAIADAVDALNSLSDDNDLAEDFEDFQNAIDPGGDGASQSDLEDYVDTIGS